MAGKVFIGAKFGMLLVLGRGKNSRHWIVRCDCGVEKTVQYVQLVGYPYLRPTRSCGCMRRQWLSEARTEHGHSVKRKGPQFSTYIAWASMHWRCENSARADYPSYGGRGIKVCERWGSFPAFLADMGLRPEGKSLGRMDNDGPYSPENCRWETPIEQARNKRSNRRIAFAGETLTLIEWAERTRIPRQSIASRIKAGWDLARAFGTPLRRQIRRVAGESP